MNYKVVPISGEIARSVRAQMKSPQYGHPAFAEIANGCGPCRACLKTFVEGSETRILFTYNAFENLSRLPLPSPVFIHEDECELFDEKGFPPDLVDLPLLFEGYGNESELVRREAVKKEKIDHQIAEIFALSAVRYINLRNSEAGCFVARIERLEG
jgi:hypothetical protein